MKKYFNGYACFDLNEMSKDELVSELKRKCRYISELRTQHAIERLKYQQLINQYDLLNKKYCEEMDKNIAVVEQLKRQQNQKAIDVLKRVKDNLLDISSPYWQYFVKTGHAFMSYEDIEQWAEEYIDNQIKECGEEKKNGD